MNTEPSTILPRVANLLVPGGGLVLAGSLTPGVAIALLFIAAANFAVGANLLFPDDFAPTWRGLGVGVAIGIYLGAQLRLAQSLRDARRQRARDRRVQALRTARSALAVGQVDQAWQALEPLAEQVEQDLVLAYWVAQVLTARGDGPAALAAWRRVRLLDHHHIYRREIEQAQRVLTAAAGRGTSETPRTSPRDA